ncbi:hypothetical protein OHA79_26230 [Streptomyces sp. NBC_00841]|uniref:hypothetical protein n=1 Tax=unclassified Streptomyces TaxID=2593676 RepID=UPI002250EB83|nr:MULTISPECIES: hypothetical protein [unclassified Streptomyces]MCX4533563.1 hypothetical protein [Streptomyces sp. NBC_01669]WSA01030.1 hypothetical protein OHA79_26230 [Streptomyces sp. NBC_00841]
MTNWIQGSFPGHEVNVVFARGVPLDVLTQGLRGLLREPLAYGEAGGWAWAVHPMLNWEVEDYDPVNYRELCPDGAEIVVFVTEPCSAKAFPPAFEYYRDGRTILCFSFEDPQQRVGENPDYLSAELLAAQLIGPHAVCGDEVNGGHDCFDHHYDDHERLVKTIAGFFALPSPPLSAEVTAQ